VSKKFPSLQLRIHISQLKGLTGIRVFLFGLVRLRDKYRTSSNFCQTILVVCLLLLGLTVASCSAQGSASLTLTSDQSTADNPQSFAQQANSIPQTRSEVPRVSAQELKQRLDSGNDVIVVDTRTLSFFDRAHIPGAIQLLGPEIDEHLDVLARDVDIVLYCT